MTTSRRDTPAPQQQDSPVDEPLSRYYAKRDFDTTPEPRGKRGRVGKRLRYVIQKHAARRLHYDFRLELDGVLKSWAVPKGPSLDPADKRMAVHVEDHPLEYGDFEGTIPAGQYGAGTVIVWDRGEWLPLEDPDEGYRKGKLKFALAGDKLSGVWNLVRMKRREGERQEAWLLIKEQDEAARPAASYSIVDELPDSVLAGTAPGRRSWMTGVSRTREARAANQKTEAPTAQNARPTKRKAAKAKVTSPAVRRTRSKTTAAAALPAGAKAADLPLMLAPQLATLVADVPRRGDWIYEVKYDGYRILTRFDDGTPRLFTRNGNDWTARMKPLAAELKQLGLGGSWLDGEVVVLGRDGNPDFQALQNSFELGRVDAIRYYLFDIPFYAGHDLREVPLWQRRDLLRKLLAAHGGDRLHFSDDFPVGAGELLATACEMRLEGVIGKLRDAPYESKRAPSWIKLKCSERQEFVVGGWTEPTHAARGIGALLLGFHEANGTLRYAGKVGTGFTDESGTALLKKLTPLEIGKAPFETGKQRHRTPVHWVKPKVMAEVSFHEWTDGGHIRHAVFLGIRADKPPRAIVRERPQPTRAVEAAAAGGAGRGSKKTTPQKRSSTSAGDDLVLRPDLGGVRLTHPERIIDPHSGTTKAELADYYASVADWLLPQLADRPVSLVRAPGGVDGKHFFQKHLGSLKIAALRELDRNIMPGHEPLIAIDDRQGLLGAVQMNVVEFHTWNGVATHIDQPDRIIFDLDPGEGVSWQAVVEGTEATRIFLEEIGLRSFLKTSGGKGLHLVVPIQRRYDWDTVKDLSRSVVEHLAEAMPDRFVAKSGPRNRVGRIFIDYLRNGRGATTVAAFAARARPGLGVSMTLDWDQLFELTGADQWHVGNAAQWLSSRADDPWADYASSAQPLGSAMKRLGYRPR